MSGCRIQNKVGIYWSNVDDNKEIDQPIMDTAGHKKSRISDKILDASFLSKSPSSKSVVQSSRLS